MGWCSLIFAGSLYHAKLRLEGAYTGLSAVGNKKSSSYIAHYIGLRRSQRALHYGMISVAPNPNRLANPTPTAIHVLQPRIMAADKARIQLWVSQLKYNHFHCRPYPRWNPLPDTIPYSLRNTTGIFIVQRTIDSKPHRKTELL